MNKKTVPFLKTHSLPFLWLCIFFCSAKLFSQVNNDTLLLRFNAASDEARIDIFDNIRDEDKTWFVTVVDDSMSVSVKRLEQSNNKRAINKYKLAEIKALYGDQKYPKAIRELSLMLQDDKSLDINDSISVYYYLKQCYFKSKDFYKALTIHKKIESLATRLKTAINPWRLTPLPSQLYYELGMYKEALELHLIEFSHIDKKFKNDYMLAGNNNNLGIYWSKIGNTDSALKYFHIAKDHVAKIILGRKPSDPAALEGYYFNGLINGNIGQALLKKNKYDMAIPLLQNDIYYSNKNGHEENSAISYNELAECFIGKKEFDLALESLDSATWAMGKKKNFDAQLQNILIRSKLYRAQNKNDLAYDMLMNYVHVRDSIRKAANEQQLINSQVAYDVEAKEAEIDKQKMAMAEASIKSERQNLRLSIAAIGLVILLFVLIVIIVNYRKSKKQQQQLELQNIEIEKQKHTIENSLKEKIMLVREIHHRVKNNLQVMSSLLSIQASKVENVDMKKLLLENRKRLNTIGLIHQSLYRNENISSVKLQEYIHSLLEQISEFYSEEGREIYIDADIKDISVDLDTAIPLGIILNELVSNSFKHAFKNSNKGSIKISLQPMEGDEYLLSVFDNGVGIPEKAWKEIEKSLGLELIQLLTSQLSGTMQTENKCGAHFMIYFTPQIVA